MAFPCGSVETSPIVTKLVDLAKPYIRELLDQSNKVYMMNDTRRKEYCITIHCMDNKMNFD